MWLLREYFERNEKSVVVCAQLEHRDAEKKGDSDWAKKRCTNPSRLGMKASQIFEAETNVRFG